MIKLRTLAFTALMVLLLALPLTSAHAFFGMMRACCGGGGWGGPWYGYPYYSYGYPYWGGYGYPYHWGGYPYYGGWGYPHWGGHYPAWGYAYPTYQLPQATTSKPSAD